MYDPSHFQTPRRDPATKLSHSFRRFGHLHFSIVAIGLASLGFVVVGHAVSVDVDLPSQLELSDPRVVVLKSSRKLHLFDGSSLVRTYDIGLGFNPVGQKRVEADGRTPLGRFRICTKNPESAYHLFMGIDYPDPPTAFRALREGLVSEGEYSGIIDAHQSGRCPIWTTAMGGGIGIHGHGTLTDWTAGCIAMNDADVEELFSVLRLGDSVEILP